MKNAQKRSLKSGQVDIWVASFDSFLSRFHHLLDKTEITRWQLFKTSSGALRYLIARILVRIALSQYVEVFPSSWRFNSNIYGRPAIAEPLGTHLDFNLSHTHRLVACAVVRNCQIGLDIEWMFRTLDIERIVNHIFAPTEMARFITLSPEKRRDCFFAYWTLKEAYVKARCMGFSLNPSGIAFDLSKPDPQVTFTNDCDDDPRRWIFRHRRLTSEYCFSLALSKTDHPIDVTFHWINNADSLDK